MIKCNCPFSGKNITTENEPEDGDALIWKGDAYGGVGGWVAGSPEEQRVTTGLLALYTFEEGSGSTVQDVSGTGTPLNLEIADVANTEWLSGGGLAVDSETIIESAGAATKIIDAVKASGVFTMEAWVKPANTTQEGPARIVTISGGSNTRNVTMGQGLWYGDPSTRIDVRCTSLSTGLNGEPSTTTPLDTLSTNIQHVVFTQDIAQTKIYIDGVEKAEENLGGGLDTRWTDTYPLALANEIGGGRPWLGEFHLVAFYDRVLSIEEVSLNNRAGGGSGGDNRAVYVYANGGYWAPIADEDGVHSLISARGGLDRYEISCCYLTHEGNYTRLKNTNPNPVNVVIESDVTLPQTGLPPEPHENWQLMDPINCWGPPAHYPSAYKAAFRKTPFGTVELRGIVARDSTQPSTGHFATLPAGYRPAKIVIMEGADDVIFMIDSFGCCGAEVNDAGFYPWYVYLDGLSFSIDPEI